MLNKRGFLFTIISLVILISILIFAIAYQNRVKELQKLDNVNILRYYEDDITANAYSDLLNIEMFNISRNNNVLINFSKLGKYALDRNNQEIMDNYRNFIVSNYSRLNNINASFDNFISEFYIRPFNSKFSLNTGILTILNPNYTQIQRINIDITVNETLDTDNNEKPAQDPTGIPIRVRFIRKFGSVIYDEERNQDAMENNAPFRLSFKTNNPPIQHDFSEVSINFGNYGENGMLIMNVDNLEGEITRLEIFYSNTDSRIVRDTNSSVRINNKDTTIVLAQQYIS